MLKKSMEEIEHTITKKEFWKLSSMTDGWSGSDLQSLAREAAMAPLRECIRRAALLKRRRLLSNSHRKTTKIRSDNTECVQDEKEKSGNNYQSNERKEARGTDAFTGTQNQLLKEFRNLRPVNFRDYTNALAFRFSGTHDNPNDSLQAECGWTENDEENDEANGIIGDLKEHYDSSSEEDDEEEVVLVEEHQSDTETSGDSRNDQHEGASFDDGEDGDQQDIII